MRPVRFPILIIAGFFAFGAFVALDAVFAGDSWPRFRGPDGQGHTDAKDLPVTWSEDKNVVWKTDLPGEGWSSPVVSPEGKIWMTTALDEGKSVRALCVDFATGKILKDIEVFQNQVVPPKHKRNSHASPTPILDGDRLYVHFGDMGTACLSTETGKKLWEVHDFIVDYQNGAGGSPTLYKDRLLIPCDGMKAQYEVALDKMTGKVLWKTERSAVAKLAARPEDMRKAYGTPLVITVDGKDQSISTGAERLYAMDPNTGKELWYVDYPGFSNVPVPVTDGKMVFVCTGFGKPQIWGILLGGASGDVTGSHVVWKQLSGAPDQCSPLLVNNRIYMVGGGGFATCLDAETGTIVWKQRIGSDFAASPIYANGRIYFFDCVGKTTVIEPGDTYKEVAANELGSGFMASPAVVGKSLVLRTKTSLYRIENKP